MSTFYLNPKMGINNINLINEQNKSISIQWIKNLSFNNNNVEEPIKNLKQIMKFIKKTKKNNICYIDKLSKKELSNFTFYLSNIIKIQKQIRKYLSGTKQLFCPLSLTNISYPYFSFKPNKSKHFIYYNIKILYEHLYNSGDFRDPNTREIYDYKIINKINNLKNLYNILGEDIDINSKMYIEKKNRENLILVIERCLDEISSNIRDLLEESFLISLNKTEGFDLNSNKIPFDAYSYYFKRLVCISKNDAFKLIDRNIIIYNEVTDKFIKRYSTMSNINEMSLLRDKIISFLFCLKEKYTD